MSNFRMTTGHRIVTLHQTFAHKTTSWCCVNGTYVYILYENNTVSRNKHGTGRTKLRVNSSSTLSRMICPYLLQNLLPFNDFLLDNCSHYIAQPKNLPKINFYSITLDMHIKRFLALPHTSILWYFLISAWKKDVPNIFKVFSTFSAAVMR